MKKRQFLFSVVTIISLLIFVICVVAVLTPHYRNLIFNKYYRETLKIEKYYPLIDVVGFGYLDKSNTIFLAISAEKEFFENQTDYTMNVFYSTLRNAIKKMITENTKLAVILYLAKQDDGTYLIAFAEIFEYPQLFKEGYVNVGVVAKIEKQLAPQLVMWEGNPFRK